MGLIYGWVGRGMQRGGSWVQGFFLGDAYLLKLDLMIFSQFCLHTELLDCIA